MEATHRIKVKLGLNEFEAEGKQELVKQQYADFLEAVKQTSISAPIAPPPTQPKPNTPTEENVWVGSKIPTAILDRIFRKGDPLSLLATPRSEKANADSLLVLIYGLTELKGEQAVTGTTLRKSASKSGVNVNRIGETLNAHADLIQAGGERKGRRYSLNNRGIAEAERIIKGMVE